MAAMAALRMFSGVMKSGSPALKSTTSTPSRRRLSASAITFMVEEALISAMRSAMAGLVSVGVILGARWFFMRCNAAPQLVFDERRNKSGDIAAKRGYFTDQ